MIRIRSIKGDLVELFFNPREKDEGLRVGENLLLQDREGAAGLIVQVIGLETVSYPALIREQMELAAEGGALPPPELFEALSSEEMPLGNLLVARARIRKVVEGNNGFGKWHHWDGWIPTRDVVVERVPDRMIAANCLGDRGHLLRLGRMRGGRDMLVEGRCLEKVNIITGVKGGGQEPPGQGDAPGAGEAGSPMYRLRPEQGVCPPPQA